MMEKSATIALKILHYPERGSNHDEQTSHVHGVSVLPPRYGATRLHGWLPHQSQWETTARTMKNPKNARCTKSPTMMIIEPMSSADKVPED